MKLLWVRPLVAKMNGPWLLDALRTIGRLLTPGKAHHSVSPLEDARKRLLTVLNNRCETLHHETAKQTTRRTRPLRSIGTIVETLEQVGSHQNTMKLVHSQEPDRTAVQVRWSHKSRGSWKLLIRHGGVWKDIGSFSTASDAAKHAEVIARDLYGSDAPKTIGRVPWQEKAKPLRSVTKHMKQQIVDVQCKQVTHKGTRCKKDAVEGGRCMMHTLHYPVFVSV